MTTILNQSRRSALLGGALALVLALTAAPAPTMAAPGPSALITDVGTQAIQSLNGDLAGRTSRLSQLFAQDFDVNGIGLFALGRYRAMATPQEMQEFFRLYPAFTVKAFNSQLDDFRGSPFRVTGKRKIGGETVITSQIMRGGSPVQIDWHLTKSGPAREYRIADLSIAGTSMKLALRDRFASWIEGNGGQFRALLAVMRQQLAEAR